MKSVTFSVEGKNAADGFDWAMWSKWGIGMVSMTAEQVWRFVGARHGVQAREEIGLGYDGWYWRNSIGS